jgi:hypothetical protein
MDWFRNLLRKPSNAKSLFPGERLGINQILALNDSTKMIIEFSYGLSDKIHMKGFDSLSHPERVLHHVYWLETEINNGGFEQYFGNSSGDYAIDTPAALDEIGAHQTAQLVRRAMDLFPGGPPPSDRQKRVEKLNLMDDDTVKQLSALDSEFLEYRDPLEELQIKYMMANKDQIHI